MGYKILADVVIFLHFLWILFIILGFALTVFSWKKFCNNFLLRIIHLLSILYTAYLEITEKYCPLTVLENYFKTKSGNITYTGSFIIYNIEKLVYPDVPPMIVIIPTICIGIITLVMFGLKPPKKLKTILCGK
ncbi:MAG: DUF2784 domain-containing protein [Elusimicrobiota bacterium]